MVEEGMLGRVLRIGLGQISFDSFDGVTQLIPVLRAVDED